MTVRDHLQFNFFFMAFLDIAPPTGSKPVIKVNVSFSQRCHVVDSSHGYYVLSARLRSSPTGTGVRWPVKRCLQLIIIIIIIIIIID